MVVRIFLIFLILFQQGCSAGYVKGDLAGYDYKANKVSYCSDGDSEKFQISIKTDATDDYAENLSGYISVFTLGIFPTYMPSFDKTEVKVLKNGTEIYQSTYKSTSHKFYGWLWTVLPESINSVSIDEGSGIRIETAVIEKTALKAIEELAADYPMNVENSCLIQVFTLN